MKYHKYDIVKIPFRTDMEHVGNYAVSKQSLIDALEKCLTQDSLNVTSTHVTNNNDQLHTLASIDNRFAFGKLVDFDVDENVGYVQIVRPEMVEDYDLSSEKLHIRGICDINKDPIEVKVVIALDLNQL